MILRRRGLSADPAELLSITERARYLFGLRLGLAGVVVAVAFASDVGGGRGLDHDRRVPRALVALRRVVRRRRKGRGPGAAGSAARGRHLPGDRDRADGRDGGGDPAPAVRPRRRRDAPLLLPDRAEARPVAHAAVPPRGRRRSSRRPGRRMAAGIERRRRRSQGATLTIAGLVGVRPRHRVVLGRQRAPAPETEARPRPPLRDGGSRGHRPEAADIPDVLLEELVLDVRVRARRGPRVPPRRPRAPRMDREREPDRPRGRDRRVGVAGLGGTREPAPARDRPRHGSSARVAPPDARNVLVVPLLRERRQGLGAVVVERGSGHPTMRRWVVAMVEQFAEHAALALHNAWLTEERESQLRTIQGLEQQLRAHNEELEAKVAERTEELRRSSRTSRRSTSNGARLLEHVVRAAEEERTRIAHDIHDDPVQKMAALKMRLELFRRKHPDLSDIDEALEVMRVTIQSMRTLLFDLSPPTLEEEGLGSALTYLLENSNSVVRLDGRRRRDWTRNRRSGPRSSSTGSRRRRSRTRGSTRRRRRSASARSRETAAPRCRSSTTASGS